MLGDVKVFIGPIVSPIGPVSVLHVELFHAQPNISWAEHTQRTASSTANSVDKLPNFHDAVGTKLKTQDSQQQHRTKDAKNPNYPRNKKCNEPRLLKKQLKRNMELVALQPNLNIKTQGASENCL